MATTPITDKLTGRQLTLAFFMQRVEFELNTGCWLWTGKPGAGGYGVIRFGPKCYKAHRVSWSLHSGLPIPPVEVKVCHKCDTPACVNPNHLWLGSQLDNIADMVAKGRQRGVSRPGSLSPMSKLTESQVWAIRAVLREGIFNQRELSRLFSVSPMTINRIANNKLWTHVVCNWPQP